MKLNDIKWWMMGLCAEVARMQWGAMRWHVALCHRTQCTLFIGLYLCHMCQCGLHAVIWSHITILMPVLAAEPRSSEGLLFQSQYLCRTILVTPYSMVLDWRVSIKGTMTFISPKLLAVSFSPTVSISLLSFYGLVLCGWGLRTDKV